MVGHAIMNGRMDKNVSRNLMTWLTVDEAGEEGKDVLIVRVSKDTQRFKGEEAETISKDWQGTGRIGNGCTC